MTERDLLDRAINLLCGAPSGFTTGTQLDCEWENHKEKLLKDYARMATVVGEIPAAKED